MAKQGSGSGLGAGASPLFPPRYADNPAAKAALLAVVRRDPGCFGVARARWRATDLLVVCDWLQLSTVSSLGHLLRRLGIVYKRGRDYVHSPDPDYCSKLAHRDAVLAQARAQAGRVVVLFQDELTYYRQPTLARAWSAGGRHQPLARRSHRANTPTRVAATLDALDARVHCWQGATFGVRQIVAFYQQLRQAYPHAERLYLIQDNWPVHFHPDVLVALEPQESPFPLQANTRWGSEPSAAARRRWGELHLPIQLVPLPTWASWLNPIEKLWHYLKQTVLHLHPFATELTALRAQVADCLAGFAHGSEALLRYVGLLTPA